MDFNATFIGQMVSFMVFVWICKKYVWSVLMEVMDERQKKIADGLEASDRSQKDLELAQGKATALLREAKQQAAGIVDMANKRGIQIVEEAKDKAIEEGKRLIAAANADIEQEINRAKEVLRSQVASIAIAGAEKILQSSIDQAANEELIKNLAAEL